MGDISLFDNAKQVASFAGLNPKIKTKKRTNPNWYNDFNQKTVSPIR
jgi:hypothetical protein